uniref:p12-7p n=1 Tax=Pyrococcus sp. 12/1 TaxID=758582 RepID=D6MY13_9EURY|nr:hypothetical protein [Pyrococcus sp. 12/1]ADF80214.1 p12-7p [Pyrococcus sp. 12/1]
MARSKAYPKRACIQVPRYAPNSLRGLLELIFPDHLLRQKIAETFLEEVRRRGREGFPEEEWLSFILKFLGNKELEEYYKSLLPRVKEGEISRTKLQKLIEEKAQELGLVEDGHNIFNVVKGQYVIVVHQLRKLGMVYKKEGRYYTSPHFGEVLETIGRFWKDWRAGLVD